MRKRALLTGLALLLVAGCAGLPRDRAAQERFAFRMATDAFTAAVRTLTTLREQGELSDAQVQKADHWIDVASAARDKWWAAIERGEYATEPKDRLRRALDILQTIIAATDGGEGADGYGRDSSGTGAT